MLLHPRALLPLLQKRLANWSVTVLTGARQTGKTTLVRDLLPSESPNSSVYFSLDDPDERLRLAANPVSRLDHGTSLVILDEVQKQPGLMDAVKFLVDQRKGRRFLLLGSSQILLLRQIRETLAGRATLLELWPLALVELVEGDTVPLCGLDRIWERGEIELRRMAREAPSAASSRIWRERSDKQLQWGGYPGLEPLKEEDRLVWLRDFRRTYLERDLADLGRVADLDQFALAQNFLATRTAQLLSYSEVSRDLGVAVNTVKRYVRFLEISYQVHLLRPLVPTLSGRIVKSPKLYWTDTGLARFLSKRMALGDGALFETFVLDEFVRWLSWQAVPPHLHFYRTHAGREVDFVMFSPNRILAIEAKSSLHAHRTDSRPVSDLIQNVHIASVAPDAERLGLVVTRGQEVEELAPHVWTVPVSRLFSPVD